MSGFNFAKEQSGADGERFEFHYHRAIAPMLWVVFGLSAIELLVVHFVLSFWSPVVALVLSAITFSGMIWLAHAILSFRRRPVRIENGHVVLRTGTLRSLTVPIASIARVEGDISRAELRGGAAANFALIAHPNIVLRFVEPILWRSRSIDTLAHRLDDAPAFMRTIERLGDGHDRP